MRDTAYVQKAGGRWECWTDTEEGRYYLIHRNSLSEILVYCRDHNFNPIILTY